MSYHREMCKRFLDARIQNDVWSRCTNRTSIRIHQIRELFYVNPENFAYYNKYYFFWPFAIRFDLFVFAELQRWQLLVVR